MAVSSRFIPRLIDVDKVKAAFATTPSFCQAAWVQDNGAGKPRSLCLVSSLIVYAGVSPDLIDSFLQARRLEGFYAVFTAVLEVEYGIPKRFAEKLPGLFDGAIDEQAGIARALFHFENYNKKKLAKAEERERDWQRHVKEAEERHAKRRTVKVLGPNWLVIGARELGLTGSGNIHGLSLAGVGTT